MQQALKSQARRLTALQNSPLQVWREKRQPHQFALRITCIHSSSALPPVAVLQS